VCLLFLFVAGPAAGQTGSDELTLTSDQRPIQVTIEPVYQRYDDDGTTLSESTMLLTASVPVTQALRFRGRVAYADATLAPTGTSDTGVSGPTDVQVEGVYVRKVGDGSLVGKLGASLPVGKNALTPDELSTSVRMSQQVYDLRVTSLGQGLSLSPSLTWAVPVGDDVVLGLSASYLFTGSFAPVENASASYDPGNAVEIMAGADVRLSERVSVSADLTFARYGTDTQDGADRFDPGNRIGGAVQGLFRDGFTSVRLLARYRSWGESDLQASAAALPLDELDRQQVIPSQGLARLSASGRLSETVRLLGYVEGAWYEETLIRGSDTVGRVGVAPSWTPAEQVTVSPSVAYTHGTIQGIEAALRTTIRL